MEVENDAIVLRRPRHKARERLGLKASKALAESGDDALVMGEFGNADDAGACMVVRGEVWLVGLDPTLGSEIQKTRPWAVVSPPEMHDHLANGHRCTDDFERAPCAVSHTCDVQTETGVDFAGSDSRGRQGTTGKEGRRDCR